MYRILLTDEEEEENNKREMKNRLLHPPQGGISVLAVVNVCITEGMILKMESCVEQWRLLRGGRLIIMAGTESMEWNKTHKLSCRF